MQKDKVIKSLCMALVIVFSSLLSSIDHSASADQSLEVYDFDKIWYKDGDFYKDNPGGGTLILAVAYSNITPDNLAWRTVDYGQIEYDFSAGNFYFSILFQDELDEERDPEGTLLWREPDDGYIFLSKAAIDARLGSRLKRLASRNFNFSTITFQSVQYYRLYIPSFNREYVWKEFKEPDSESWYTWGSSSSIEFETKAMYTKITEEASNGIVVRFDHPTDNEGQKVAINKEYLASKGVTTPYFEWGKVKPWKPIPYTENETHYFIEPEHFSYIGMHDAIGGQLAALAVNSTLGITDKEVNTQGVGIYGNPNYDTNYYETFTDNWSRINYAYIVFYSPSGNNLAVQDNHGANRQIAVTLRFLGEANSFLEKRKVIL